MDSKLLNLTPKKYLCPYCGEWHPWEGTKLIDYDSYAGSTTLRCPLQPDGCSHGNLEIYFDDSYLYYKTMQLCGKASFNMDGNMEISNIIEIPTEARVEFTVFFRANYTCNYSACDACKSKPVCQVCKMGERYNSRNMHIMMGFEFEKSEYEAIKKEEKKMVALESNPFMRFMTTTPFQKLEPVKNWCEEHKTTLQWGAAVGAVAIAAKLLKENKKLVDEGKAMGLPFLDEKAKVTRLATVGGTYAIVYGLSNMLLKPDKEGEGLKEAVTEAEKLAAKHPRWAKRAEEVLPTAVSILIAYAMIEKPEWVERTFESSNEILNRIKSGFDFAMDWILDKSGIDDEQAKKICICLGVAIALVFLYKGAQKKEELSKMAEKFVDFSINAAKKLAPPVFASLAAVLVYMNLWPEEVMDALEAEYTEVEPEEPKKTPKKPAKKTNGRGRRKKKESNSTEATAAGVEASETEVTDEITEEAIEAADESEAE